MLRRSKVGLIVWGVILMLIGLIGGIAVLSADEESLMILAIFFLMFFLGGIGMMIGGIVSNAKTSQYNREILNQNIRYTGLCPHCGTKIDCTIRDFRPHGRYPEGYISCMVCKRPISRNVFQEVRMENYDAR